MLPQRFRYDSFMSLIQPTAIDKSLLDRVSQQARLTPRKRMNHNFHQSTDSVQRFLNAIEPDSYIRPHRHINPNRDEVFLVLRGKGGVVQFNSEGQITGVHKLDISQGCWGVDIPGGIYHTIVAIVPGSVFYEVKPGPYNPDADKGFAPWAPPEGSESAVPYLAYLKQWFDR